MRRCRTSFTLLSNDERVDRTSSQDAERRDTFNLSEIMDDLRNDDHFGPGYQFPFAYYQDEETWWEDDPWAAGDAGTPQPIDSSSRHSIGRYQNPAAGDQPEPFWDQDEAAVGWENFRGVDEGWWWQEESRQPAVTAYGTISLMLRHLVRVDMTPNGGIHIRHSLGSCAASVSPSGTKLAVHHPNCRILVLSPEEAHLVTYQGRVAKVCERGVVFASLSGKLAYVVDESGTKSTAERFKDIKPDHVTDVFFEGYSDFPSQSLLLRCHEVARRAVHEATADGDDVWTMTGFEDGPRVVKQDRFGNIEISRDSRRVLLTLSPALCELSVSTPNCRASVSCYSKRYASLEMDPRKRVASGFCGMTVDNGSQMAGLDRQGKVVIF